MEIGDSVKVRETFYDSEHGLHVKNYNLEIV